MGMYVALFQTRQSCVDLDLELHFDGAGYALQQCSEKESSCWWTSERYPYSNTKTLSLPVRWTFPEPKASMQLEIEGAPQNLS